MSGEATSAHLSSLREWQLAGEDLTLHSKSCLSPLQDYFVPSTSAGVSRRTWQWCHENPHPKKNNNNINKSSLVDEGSPNQVWTWLQKTLVRKANAPGSQVQPQGDTSSHAAGTRLSGHLGISTQAVPSGNQQKGHQGLTSKPCNRLWLFFNTFEEREKIIFHPRALLVRFFPPASARHSQLA